MAIESDVLVIGGGIAGLSSALSAARAGADVRLVTEAETTLHHASGLLDVLGYTPDGHGRRTRETSPGRTRRRRRTTRRERRAGRVPRRAGRRSSGGGAGGTARASRRGHLRGADGPPSVPGLRLEDRLYAALGDAGGRIETGGPIVDFDAEDGRVSTVYMDRSGSRIPHAAEQVVLATGDVAGGGIDSDREGIAEPIFGCHVAHPADRYEWFDEAAFGEHAFARFGVDVDDTLRPLDGASVDVPDVAYHAPCHSRNQGLGRQAVELFADVEGVDVTDVGDSCSGISGTYGWKSEKYETSMAIGEEMFAHMEAADADHGMTECPTCAMQMEHGTGYEITHPIQVLDAALQ